MRKRACEGLSFIGLAVEDQLNAGAGDRQISPSDGAVPVLVIAAREDLQIAREVRATLGFAA